MGKFGFVKIYKILVKNLCIIYIDNMTARYKCKRADEKLSIDRVHKNAAGEFKIFVHYIEKGLENIFVILNRNSAMNLCKKEKRFKTAFPVNSHNYSDSYIVYYT